MWEASLIVMNQIRGSPQLWSEFQLIVYVSDLHLLLFWFSLSALIALFLLQQAAVFTKKALKNLLYIICQH